MSVTKLPVMIIVGVVFAVAAAPGVPTQAAPTQAAVPDVPSLAARDTTRTAAADTAAAKTVTTKMAATRNVAVEKVARPSGSAELAFGEVTRAPGAPPFAFPVDGPPGPSSWLLGQTYGNTTAAHALGDVWYAAGQGLHFGIDVLVPCGTPIVSIGDGVVVQADWLARGSGPHNLVVRHPDEGVSVLYGHLLERPALDAGQPVAKGHEIGLSGDPDVTCESRPHLHMEIRSLDYRTAYNPVNWIDADWDSMMLFGPFSDVVFERDLDAPLRWVRLDDQPDVQFGGARLNDYARAWPAGRGGGACVVVGC